MRKVRYLAPAIQRDLSKKMVFLAGPRQVGKTTLAQALLRDKSGYLTWDDPEDRERILKRELPDVECLVLDELHKYRAWRNYLKGFVDKWGLGRRLLVSGSARLDYYRFGGDSLQGRYFYYRLHPLSLKELGGGPKDLSDLLALGGFPEPFFSGREAEARRWSKLYRTRLIREEISSLESVQDVGSLELLMLRLPDLVGSPLSINALREDLQKNFRTVSRWMDIFERLYVIFRIAPFGSTKIRAVKKEQKHYHFDWTVVDDMAKRFENLVACHLLKWLHFEEDRKGRDLELRYFRDVDRREVDFVILEKQKPIRFIEVKWGDEPISSGLRYLKKRFPSVESWQISAVGKRDYLSEQGIRVVPAAKFLAGLV